MAKFIQLSGHSYDKLSVNVDKIDNIFIQNGITQLTISGVIYHVEESYDDVMRMINSEPIQDGIKKHMQEKLSVSKNIKDLTKL